MKFLATSQCIVCSSTDPDFGDLCKGTVDPDPEVINEVPTMSIDTCQNGCFVQIENDSCILPYSLI